MRPSTLAFICLAALASGGCGTRSSRPISPAKRALLDGKPAEMPRGSAAMAAGTKTGAAAIARELERVGSDPARYYVDESEINSLGYHVLNARRDAAGAVAVFAFNVARFPRSRNVYDSLGEAQLAAGDREAAIRSYRKVLELDPGNKNATQVLERLQR